MISINKTYEVQKEDEELVAQFPQFVKGFQFRVVGMNKDGVIAVIDIKNGNLISIANNPEAWFWCFYFSGDINTSKELAEIDIQDEIPVTNDTLVNGVPVLDLLKGQLDPVSKAAVLYIEELTKELEWYMSYH